VLKCVQRNSEFDVQDIILCKYLIKTIQNLIFKRFSLLVFHYLCSLRSN